MSVIKTLSETVLSKVVARMILSAVLALPATSSNAVENATIKCWTNHDGVRECGNVIPPEYAQQGHEVKSSTGMTVKKQGRARTQEEVARARVEQAAVARKQAAADAIARKQAAADKVLLDTFSSEDDLVLARDGQIMNLDSQIKLTEGLLAKLQKSLDQMISKAADYERRGQKLPGKLGRNIESMQGQIVEHRKFIETKRAEQVSLRTKFEFDIARFRELRSAQR